jgi:hypothetical protein
LLNSSGVSLAFVNFVFESFERFAGVHGVFNNPSPASQQKTRAYLLRRRRRHQQSIRHSANKHPQNNHHSGDENQEENEELVEDEVSQIFCSPSRHFFISQRFFLKSSFRSLFLQFSFINSI